MYTALLYWSNLLYSYRYASETLDYKNGKNKPASVVTVLRITDDTVRYSQKME